MQLSALAKGQGQPPAPAKEQCDTVCHRPFQLCVTIRYGYLPSGKQWTATKFPKMLIRARSSVKALRQFASLLTVCTARSAWPLEVSGGPFTVRLQDAIVPWRHSRG